MEYKSDIETLSESTRKIKIEISKDAYETKFNKILNKTASVADLKGFRKGKAPKSYIKKMYGPQIKSDVIGELFDNAYKEVVTEHKLKIVGQPKIDFADEDFDKGDDIKDLVINAEVALYPEPEIKDYKKLKLKIDEEKYSDDLLDQRIKSICEQQSKIEEVTSRKTAKEGDLAMVSFHPEDKENAPFGESDSTYLEIGKEGHRKALADKVKGMKVEEEKTASVKIEVKTEAEGDAETKKADSKEEDKQKDSAKTVAKSAKYIIKLISLHKKEVPEFNDEIAKNSGLAENAKELKAKIKSHIETEIRNKNKQAFEEAYALEVYKKNSFEIPQALVDEEVRRLLFEMGFLDPNKRESYNVDLTRFREVFGEKAHDRAKQRIIYGRLKEIEKPEANDEQVEKWLDTRAKEDNIQREELNKYYDYPNRKEEIRDLVALQSMIDTLIAQCK